jgi:hypothetical protein
MYQPCKFYFIVITISKKNGDITFVLPLVIYNLHNLSSILLSRMLREEWVGMYDSTEDCLEAYNLAYNV